ncbi:MAG: DEAD/DEAH box helicase [Salinisphaeraceae bacterium]
MQMPPDKEGFYTCTVSIPEAALASCRARKRADCLREWITRGLKQSRPVPVGNGQARKPVALRLTPDEVAAIERYRHAQSLAPSMRLGTVVGMLAHTGWRASGEVEDRDKPDSPRASWHGAGVDRMIATLARAGQSHRPEQETMLGLIDEAVEDGKVRLMEAATGSGKTLAMAVAAVDCAIHRGQRVLIAVPNLRSVNDTMASLSLAANDRPVRIASAIGANEFVSEERVSDLIESGESDVAGGLRAWVAEQTITRGWRVSEFCKAFPGFNSDQVSLNHGMDESDAGRQAYDHQFESLDERVDVLVITHAMLAQNVWHSIRQHNQIESVTLEKADLDRPYSERARLRNRIRLDRDGERPGKLGFQGAILFVDEAHQLRNNIETGLSSQVRLGGIRTDLVALQKHLKPRAAKACERALAELAFVEKEMGELGRREGYASLVLNLHQAGDHRMVRDLRDLLTDASKGLPRKNGRVPIKAGDRVRIERLRMARTVLSLALSRKIYSGSDASIQLSFSSVRHTPSIQVGQPNIGAYLSYLWEAAPAAILASATLYLDTRSGLSGTYMARKLLVPEDQLATQSRRILPKWLREGVRVHQLPVKLGISKKSRLAPPSMNHGGSGKKRWHTVLSVAVYKIAQEATGGTLVLCTSHETCHALYQSLIGRLGDRLVVVPEQGGSQAYARCRDRFIEAGTRNERPVWIATGPAWAGEDLGGAGHGLSSEDDLVLTDLVIPRLPFPRATPGDNSSSSFYVSSAEMMLALTQAVGRLIRRPGLKGRQLWLLDPRGSDPGKGYNPMVQSLVHEYKHREVFSLRPEDIDVYQAAGN